MIPRKKLMFVIPACWAMAPPSQNSPAKNSAPFGRIAAADPITDHRQSR
jgi:hypothetical protein